MKKCFYCGEFKNDTWGFDSKSDLHYCDDCSCDVSSHYKVNAKLCGIIAELKAEIQEYKNYENTLRAMSNWAL